MQDLMAKLQGILGTQEGQAELAKVAGMLAAPQEPSPPPQIEPPQGGGLDFSAIASMLSGLSGGNSAAPEPVAQNSGMPNIDINMIMILQKAFSNMKGDDKNTQLLLALKPHFKEERRAKVDQAMSIMKLISMWPALKESGILSSFLK